MQVERIMDGLRLAAVNRKSDASPRQVLVFSQHWSPELGSFVAENLINTTVAIASTMEAFYAGGVKTVSGDDVFLLTINLLPDILNTIN